MTGLIKPVIALIGHEIRLELKNRHGLTSLAVYAVASIYISYLAFRQSLDPVTWNALFWIIMLFAATNAVAKSFLQESRGLQFYQYTFLDPRAVILSKSIYNIFLLSCLGLLNLAFYSLFFESPVKDMGGFIVSVLLGSAGLSGTLTLVSGIVSRANNNAALVAILGFPLLFPLLITTIKYSLDAVQGNTAFSGDTFLIILIALNVIIMLLGYLLFPYLWRE